LFKENVSKDISPLKTMTVSYMLGLESNPKLPSSKKQCGPEEGHYKKNVISKVAAYKWL